MLRRTTRIGLAIASIASIAAGCGAGTGPSQGDTAASSGGSGVAAVSPASPRARAAAAQPLRARWVTFLHLRRPVDLAGPRADGSLVLEANGRLFILSASGAIRPVSTRYRASPGLEPYIALAPRGSCYAAGATYAIRLQSGRGVTEIARSGQVRRFAAVSDPGLINGIAFDTVGRFAHRLLLTVNAGHRTALLAVDCHGHVRVITRSAPRVEGGITVAPASFGRFGGDLIAPDEISGRLYAITPAGHSTLLAASGIAHGPDTGVESEAFMPPGRLRPVVVADRRTPGNHHPGDDVLLRIGARALAAAGVRPGDLLAVSEGGAQTVDVRCGPRSCTVEPIADGPAVAHIEGHVVVAG